MVKFLAFFILSTFSITWLIAQPDTLIIPLIEDFQVDGTGGNENWKKVDWAVIPQRDELDRKLKTKVKIIYSQSGIYALYKCEDDQITSTLKEDFANLWEEDVVEIFFWTSEDYPFYFEYELSPTNYELPIFVPNVKGDFMGWRPWRYEKERKTIHKTSVKKVGQEVKSWTAEFFIPFALLKPMANVPPKPGTVWRANMYRLDYDKNPTRWEWQAIRTNFHDFENYGYFFFGN